MSTLSENTPVYTVRKTPEEAQNEMKEETKKEMEKLKDLMKARVNNIEVSKPLEYDEIFLENSEDDDISIESEDSDDTKQMLKQITNSIQKKSKINHKKHNKSVDSKYGVVDSAVKVEKLKSEISKLESRLRYKDLDMVNLMHTQNELNVIVNKFKLFEDVLSHMQITEVKVNDLRNNCKMIIENDSNKIILHQLNQLDYIYEPLSQDINSEIIDDKLIKINNPNFSRLILHKKDYILSDLQNLKNHISYIKKDIINRNYIFNALMKCFLISGSISVLVLVLYFYFS
jgi:hypothetical protein